MSGLDIDTRSDIYSLGVLLYEFLTGRPPFNAKELLAAGLDEMRRTIREVEPVKPSTRLTQELVAADVRRRTSRSEFEESASSPQSREALATLGHQHLGRTENRRVWIAFMSLSSVVGKTLGQAGIGPFSRFRAASSPDSWLRFEFKDATTANAPLADMRLEQLPEFLPPVFADPLTANIYFVKTGCQQRSLKKRRTVSRSPFVFRSCVRESAANFQYR